MEEFLLGCALCAFTSVALYWLLNGKKIKGKRAHASTIQKYPLIGNVLALNENDAIDFFDKSWAEAGEGDFEFTVLGMRMISFSNKETIDYILAKRPKHFRRDRGFEGWATELGLRNGLFNAEGSVWNRVRSITSTSFVNHNVINMFPIVCEKCVAMVDDLKLQIAATSSHASGKSATIDT